MEAIAVTKGLTVAEYLAMEADADEKHEYYGGVVYAMAGAGFAHNQIAANAMVDIGYHLKNKSCSIYGSDLKVHVKTKSSFVYPDLSIVCNGPQFFEGTTDVVTNPTVIFEVLSPKTQDFDHGQKFMLYRQIPTLKEYILISSMAVMAERFSKEPSGEWTLKEWQSADDILTINAIQFSCRLADLYTDVEFEG